MDLNSPNPFADLMNKAVKLKGHQQAQLRPIYDRWPQHFQHSMFMQDSIISLRSLSFQEKLNAAKELKEKGNHFFSLSQYDDAITEFEKALAIFKYCENIDPGWKKKGIEDKDIRVVIYTCDNDDEQTQLDIFMTSCYLNIAVSKFRLNEFSHCIHACDDALDRDPINVKAFYRRAIALITPASSGALEFDQAISDLRKAYKINPKNTDVRTLLRKLVIQKERQKKLDKETFSGMFDRGQIIDDNEISQPEEDDEKLNATDAADIEKKEKRKFEKELTEAEDIAQMMVRQGDAEGAKKVREKISIAKQEYNRRYKQIDFFHPTEEMIEDGKNNGIDLTDKNVQQMLHDLQKESREKTSTNSTDQSKTVSNDDKMIEAMLKTMSSEEIAELLQSEGIDCHKITHPEHYKEVARDILKDRLNRGHASEKFKKNKISSSGQASYFRLIFGLAIAWTLLRLYTSGGLSIIGRLLMNQFKGGNNEETISNIDKVELGS